MQLPIPIGTILQNRYHILNVLGQGGFGRTYLAEDQGRFNEPCALKELIPAQSGGYALEKSKELFQREATILYQISHPQIPQFRATFEQDQRLFLVQDYVEGKTYRELLNDRRMQSIAFSEVEVLQWLELLLPVLEHIHGKGIIHRDISPDNIILRQRDQLPVLIDFGVVKELATRIQFETTEQATTVGKLGYSPSEQMQSGRAYPSSDLYSLAVTAIVLLTGREPQELFNDSMLTWQWQQRVAVSPALAYVLNKMLSQKPGDRYQTTTEVIQALQGIHLPVVPPSGAAPVPPAPVPPARPASSPDPELSQMATMAVGRRPEPVGQGANQGGANQLNRPNPMISPRSSVWDDPVAVVMVGLCLALLTGIGVWAVTSFLLRPSQPTPPDVTPTVVITPTIAPTPTPTPVLTPTPSPVTFSQRLTLAPGQPNAIQGSLRANETINYIISGQQGQQLVAALAGQNVVMNILGPNQEVVEPGASQVVQWTGTLPFTGDHVVQLSTTKGAVKSDYRLNVQLVNPASPSPIPTPIPTLTPTPTPTPVASIDSQPVTFSGGETRTQVSGRTSPRTIKRYLISAQKDQVLSVEINQGAVTLTVRYPDGRLVEDASGVVSWQAQIPNGGEYQVDVIGTEDTAFTLNVSVR